MKVGIDDSSASRISLKFVGIWRIEMGFIKKLICKHDYEQEYLHMIDGGMDKLYKLSCRKCGKEIYVRGGLLYKYFRSERQ